jgi:pyruvate,orthophosphate dikinase
MASDLYFLQTRDIDVGHTVTVQTFADSFTLEESRLGAGVGVGGGALSGRVAYTMEDIERLRAEQPDGKIILIRPDTVPDDIRLISRVDGLLTSVGGATSHAAVAALRLGRTCVVGCRQLQVRDEEGWSELAGHTLRAGDPLSIDGLSGQIYSGTHPVSQIQLHEPASQ